MQIKDKKELHTKSIDELKKILNEKKSERYAVGLELAQKKLKNTSDVGNKRKEIAQLLTIVREKELAAQAESGASK